MGAGDTAAARAIANQAQNSSAGQSVPAWPTQYGTIISLSSWDRMWQCQT
jgi:hypothetical protein